MDAWATAWTRYRAKRDFDATPEPGGRGGGRRRRRASVSSCTSTTPGVCTGTCGSSATACSSRGPSRRGSRPIRKRNHLAVHTEDHPLEYIDFHGDIPAGQYGAGTMKIWDRGTYETHKFRDKEVMITFHGERLHGRYVLFRTRGDDWMIHRMDPPEDPDREPMPERVEPMLARTGELPRDDGEWAYEIKWDGVRAIGYVDGGRLRLESRNGNDITPRYPELRGLGPALGSHGAIFDGEVVAFDDGRPLVPEAAGAHAPDLRARGAAPVGRPTRSST